jgi:F-type H+-transporting ATPase subunit b
MDLLIPGFGLIIWTLLAFLIVFFVLKKFAWKPILSALSEREEGIANAIASADRLKAEMAQIKNENEALLAKAREEKTQIIKDAKDAADKLVADAKEKGKAEYERIIADAQAAIEHQKNAALTDVKNIAGKLALEVSEKLIRKQLAGNAEQESFVKQLVQEVKLN